MERQDPFAELLKHCSHGDGRAFEELYRKSSARLYAICLGMLRREDLAEDVLQEAFINIWRRAGSFDASKGAALTWMTSIVRNRALDLLRSAHVQAGLISDEFNDEHFASHTPSPVASAAVGMSAEAVEKCLQQLKTEQRRCIMMAYYYGHTHDELSTLTGTPLGTVKAWIRRGLEKLRECLG
jgi:RNA polymerase sigma-70 factor (ECF subfamily)